MYMSKSDLSPSDAAWAVLKQTNDPDKIEKILPLIPLALAGYGAYRGYQNVTDPRGPVVTDPLTGGYLYEREVDPTLGGYAAAFGSGALEGVGLGGAAKLGAKGVSRLAGSSASKRAAARQAASDHARKETTERLARQEADTALAALNRSPITPGGNVTYAPARLPSNLDDMAMARARTSPYVTGQARGAARAAYAPGARREAVARGVQRGAGKVDDALSARALGYGALGAGALGLGGAYLANRAQEGLENAYPDPNTSGFGAYGGTGSGGFGQSNTGGAASGFGEGTGIGGVSNQFGNITDREKIWEKQGGQGVMEAQRQAAGGGAYGTNKGENMKIGERMLKQAEDIMYKAVCPACGKKDCNCKEYKNKKEDSKKPAHGMVIVIGTKAGPGPYKNGKREKLDSEKDEKEE